MAMSKDKEIKGINVPYHKIVDCDVKNGYAMVAHYVDKAAAVTRGNMIGGRDKIDITFALDVSSPLEYAYTQMKVSDMSEAPEGYDSKVSGEFVPEEQNFYADAVNC